jgi:hypothetical protein
MTNVRLREELAGNADYEGLPLPAFYCQAPHGGRLAWNSWPSRRREALC